MSIKVWELRGKQTIDLDVHEHDTFGRQPEAMALTTEAGAPFASLSCRDEFGNVATIYIREVATAEQAIASLKEFLALKAAEAPITSTDERKESAA